MGQSTSLLQSLLEGLKGYSEENPDAPKVRVYFQPPANTDMEYPCITFERDDAETRFANNSPYFNTFGYDVTVIDQDPESELLALVAALPMCSFNRHFVSDNLNHDVYKLYF